MPTKETQKVQRPVMIFFDSQETLFAFHNSTLMESLKKEVAVVTEATPEYEKDSLFLKATEAGAITLMIRDFGRGTDFKCFDRRVLNAGGVHVIQAFFSKDLSEEIQIMGRCARQGTDGSFRYEHNGFPPFFLYTTDISFFDSMILNVEDLHRDFGLSRDEAETMRLSRSLYTSMNAKRAITYSSGLTKRKKRVIDAENLHYRSLACRAALESGLVTASKRQEIISFFDEINGLGTSRSFRQAGLKASSIAARTKRYKLFKANDRKKRTKARETLLLEASMADKKRLETRERLKGENLSHYTMLGLERDATTDDVKVAFRALSILFHPDKCKDADATDIFRKLREAYVVLSCDEKRAAYDAHEST